jgi:hypothetical protein
VALHDTDVFDRLERFYDAVPRDAAVAEDIGGFVLFVREGEGWPYYARPRLGAETPSAADVTAVRRRQRELGAPEAFEWVHETTPDLLAVARSAGLVRIGAPGWTTPARRAASCRASASPASLNGRSVRPHHRCPVQAVAACRTSQTVALLTAAPA